MTITRRNFMISTAAVAAVTLMQTGGSADAQSQHSEPDIDYKDDPHTLWYTQPAANWEEALPVGNGRLGAMIFGGIEHERLQLNEITVWSGGPEPNADRADAWTHLPELRAAIRAEDRPESDRLAQEYFMSAIGYDPSYQTLGDLTFDSVYPAGDVSDYVRTLNIGNATSTVGFTINGDRYSREVFSSAPAGLLAIRFSCTKAGSISFTTNLLRAESAATVAQGDDMLVMTGNTDHRGQKGNLDYEVVARVIVSSGTVTSSGTAIVVTGADEATVLLAAGTSYVLDFEKNYRGVDPHEAVQLISGKSFNTPFTLLKQNHIHEYQSWFNRVTIDLGKSANAALPTDQRLANFHTGTVDPQLPALFYQYGRYMLISSSRPDNPLPSNSQGIWGDGFELPWKCDYKSNINFFMNYWPVETTNLGDCHLPAIRLIESLVEPGRRTAKAYYNVDGWYYIFTTNAWGWTAPGQGLPWGVWTCASGWACQHLWEHYAFSRDLTYLKRVYPVMKEAAQFYLNAMIPDADGFLVTSPSTSPENGFVDAKGVRGEVTEGCTVEREIVWDLFTNVVLAATVLQTDNDFQSTVAAALAKIRTPVIGSVGQIEEWPGDWDVNDPEPHHRHISHLFAVIPGHQITPEGTPDLAAAAGKTMEMRGDEGTGWSKAWKINVMARLHDGDHAYRLLSDQLEYVTATKTSYSGGGGTYANLMDAHPPFQIDGNFGALSGITEMLLQSHRRYIDADDPSQDRYIIELLPALPSAWSSGSITGLRARGGFEIDIQWTGGKLVAATIKSVGGSKGRVQYGDKVIDLRIKSRRTIKLNASLT